MTATNGNEIKERNGRDEENFYIDVECRKSSNDYESQEYRIEYREYRRQDQDQLPW